MAEPVSHVRSKAPSGQRESLSRHVFKILLRAYMRAWHDLEVTDAQYAPTHGPVLVMTNHASILDTPILMAADPYSSTAMVAKASMFRVPVVSRLLKSWRAIPVERQGDDVASVRALLGALRDGCIVGVAPEGKRSLNGRLGEINPVLARLAARSRVPIVPIGIVGAHLALPPGARFPRRTKIVIKVGRPFQLDPSLPGPEAASQIQAAIAALLPPDQQPKGWTRGA